MALFLEQTLDTDYTETTLEEAYVSLLETQADMAELNEAILQADFVLHERAKTLTEAEALHEEENFLTRVVNKVREIVLKVKETTARFFVKLKETLSNFWRKLTGKGEVKVDKKAYDEAESVAATFNKYYEAATNGSDDPNVFKKSLAVAEAALKTAIEKARNGGSRTKDFVTTKTSNLSGMQKFFAVAGATVVTGVLVKQLGLLDKAKSAAGNFSKESREAKAAAKEAGKLPGQANFVGPVTKKAQLTANAMQRVSNYYGIVSGLFRRSVKAEGGDAAAKAEA